MRRHVVTVLLAAAFLTAAPASAQAAAVAAWPFGSDAHDSSGHGHDGSAKNVAFDGSALFNGQSSRITVPFSSALSPGTADVTASVRVNTTHRPGTGNHDFDLMRASPTGKMYKIELFPHGKVKAQAQCIFVGSANRTTVHAGPSLDDGRWHSIVCREDIEPRHAHRGRQGRRLGERHHRVDRAQEGRRVRARLQTRARRLRRRLLQRPAAERLGRDRVADGCRPGRAGPPR